MQTESDSHYYVGVAARGASWTARVTLRAAPHLHADANLNASNIHLLTCKTALEAAVAHDLGCCWAALHTSQQAAANAHLDW